MMDRDADNAVSSHNEAKRAFGPFAFIAVIVVLPLLYVLSHAPLMRLLTNLGVETESHPKLSAAVICFYVPVEEYLIDRTMWAEPLLAWSDLWQMGDAFRTDRYYRFYLSSPEGKRETAEMEEEDRHRNEVKSVSQWSDE